MLAFRLAIVAFLGTALVANAGPLQGGAAKTCPGSAAWGPHAKTEISLTFQNSCASVQAEIEARVKGPWVDPHNKGSYSITESSSSQIELERKTGNNKYTDKMIFTFSDGSSDGSSCSVNACSESQVTSVLDFSTNYCNLHDLYCSDSQCNADKLAGHTKLTYTEDIKTCSSGQHKMSDCYKASAEQLQQKFWEGLRTPESDVTLYKIQGSICGQSSLDAKYAPYAEKFAGLKEGTCASQGYTVADGSKTIKVPVLGSITTYEFKKPSEVAFAVKGMCQKTCRDICCKNGGGDACVTACGCPAGSCPHDKSRMIVRDLGKAQGMCQKTCRDICCKNGGGDACVTACGCPAGSCPHEALGDDSTTTFLSSFDGKKAPKWSWKALNDPVMGGASTSTFTIDGDHGVFNGTCAIVKFLKAPGFAKAVGTPSGDVADISQHLNGSLAFMVRSSTPQYKGYKVAFAAKDVPKTSIYGGGSYKASFQLSGDDWQVVKVPFSSFSYDWSGYTGNCDTKDPGFFGRQHHCCSSEHPEVCPKAKYLKSLTEFSIWAEGVQGDFHIEVQWVGATN